MPLASHGQSLWSWTQLTDMPVPVANNAVAGATVNGVPYVYSFTGIDTTKHHGGIHLNSYRYNTQTTVWETIASVPDTMGKVAAGASTVNNTVYVLGGYHVLANTNEISSNRVHRYDPENNVWLSDGAAIPTPIDDHVQAVWRDSLIFVVTGWSNTGNVSAVQIYDPANDSWQTGTQLLPGAQFAAFGASGEIVGDTIYYHGGAAGFSFTGRKHLRKGIINPNDPTQITWSYEGDSPSAPGYRHAAITYGDNVFWVGGSGNTYNYNGVAYDGSGGVPPLDRILRYETTTGNWLEGLGQPYAQMDLRGAAQIASNQWIICGGMEANQTVSARTFLLEYDTLAASLLENKNADEVLVYPNPASQYLNIKGETNGTLSLYSLDGKLHLEQKAGTPIDVSHLARGSYTWKLTTAKGVSQGKVILQ